MSSRRLLGLILAALLASACTPDDDSGVTDDMNSGDSLADGKADGYSVPSSLGLDKNGIFYLTFDDGPSKTLTPRILDVLAKHNAKATFFVLGSSVKGNEALLQRQVAEGHILGNHQWKHEIATSESQFRSWVTDTHDALAAATGEGPHYFRYPYGAMKSWKETILKELGYQDGGIGWEIDSLDWDFGTDGKSSRDEVPAAYRSDFIGYVVQQAEHRGGGVMLFHDVQSITANNLDEILTRLEADGYTFGGFPTVRVPPVPTTFVGDPCTVTADCNFTDGLCHLEPGETAGNCTTTCTASCPDRAGYATTRCVLTPDASGADVALCAITCTDGCPTGTSCVTLLSPAGLSRDVCW